MKFLKKLKARGFTLIELIATIALLAIIVLISFVSVNAIINKNKERQYENLKSSIKIAAKQYASENKYSDEFSNKTTVVIPLSKLVDNGYLSSPVIDPYTNKPIGDLSSIVITLYISNGEVTNLEISGMPEHGENSNNPEIDNQGEIVNNDDNGNDNNDNNNNNGGNNNTKTYKLTLSCHSDLNPKVNYNNCWIDGDNTKILEIQANATINLNDMMCSCYQGVSHVGWADKETMTLYEFGNFTMPEKDIILYALYETE